MMVPPVLGEVFGTPTGIGRMFRRYIYTISCDGTQRGQQSMMERTWKLGDFRSSMDDINNRIRRALALRQTQKVEMKRVAFANNSGWSVRAMNSTLFRPAAYQSATASKKEIPALALKLFVAITSLIASDFEIGWP